MRLIDKLKKGRDPNSTTLSELVESGDRNFRLGKFRDAIVHYDRALELDPNNVRALHNKGLAFFGLNKFNKSIEFYDKALKVRPRSLDIILNKAISLNSLKKFETAKRLLDEIIMADPTNKKALNTRALSEFKLGLDEGGMNDLMAALKIDPGYVMAWNNLGCFYLGLGDYDEAIACFDKSLRIEPRDYDAFLLKDMALVRKEASGK
jgi:eukaryotic-like serine/threonine-protein kinase